MLLFATQLTSKKPLCGFFASAFIFEQSRPDDSAAAVIHSFSLQEQCKHYERDLYERKTGAAAVGIHALPNVISMLVNSLYNIVDSLFVARISEDAMTALSLVFPIQNFANAIAIGFGIGINAMIALYLGAGDHKKAETAATHGMALSLMHGILITIVSIVIMPGFLRRFTSDAGLIASGITYSTIVFLFATINMAALAFEKMFQAVGRMKVTMAALIFGCVCNILLDPILIFGLGPVPAWALRVRPLPPASASC